MQDKAQTRYYEQKMAAFADAGDDIPTVHAGTPRLAGNFTGWKYREMREVVPFCAANDPLPPDARIREELIADGRMRAVCGAPEYKEPSDHE